MKPCKKCGLGISNNDNLCPECGAEQLDGTELNKVQDTKSPIETSRPPRQHSAESIFIIFCDLLQATVLAAPVVLAFVGYWLDGVSGAAIGAILGVMFWGLWGATPIGNDLFQEEEVNNRFRWL